MRESKKIYRDLLLVIMACLGLFSIDLLAQPLQWNPNRFVVKDQKGVKYLSPFSGGIGNARFQFVNLMSIDRPDLLLLNGDGKCLFFKNTGVAGKPSFELQMNTNFLPPITDWFRFYDFNGDGKEDLLKEVGNSASYYRNVGTNESPAFVLFQDTLRDQQNRPIIVESLSIPVVSDINGDTKADVLSGNSIGTINFYKNISTNDSLKFQFVTGEFGCIRALFDTVFVDDCNNRVLDSSESASSLIDSLNELHPRSALESHKIRPTASLEVFGNAIEHGASALSFGDIDGNGTLDLLFGDFIEESLYFFRNIGSEQSPQFELGARHFPSLELLNTRGFNLAQTLDIDADGDLDLFVSSLSVRQSKKDFIFYRNIGTAQTPNFIIETDQFLNPFDVGLNAKPAFGDLNGDGKIDMLIGNNDGELALYTNTGTASTPEWQLENPIFIQADIDPVSPALVDIDNDGDLDLFVGRYFIGRLRFFRNNGSSLLPQFVEEVFSPTSNINVGQIASPFFFDVDQDGDFDLFIGDDNGNVEFYRNTGTAQLASYSLVTNSLIRLPNFAANASPCLMVENDTLQLFVGGSEGKIAHYTNTVLSGNPVFTLVNEMYENIDAGGNASPYWLDVNNDGKKELFIGTQRGGIELYDRTTFSNTPKTSQTQSFILFQNYPNPFNPSTIINYQLFKPSKVLMEIYDTLGKKIAILVNQTQVAGIYEVIFDATSYNLTSGIYFYKISANGLVTTKKMMLLK